MKASSKITVVLGDYKEQYNDALENLHRAMKAILPHDLSTVTVMLSVVMVGVSAYDNGFEEHKDWECIVVKEEQQRRIQ
ncbi:hypothetical protein JHK85_006352 [Glycine max]|nr:hypothetical protein JHK85_006352 [Glycine max]